MNLQKDTIKILENTIHMDREDLANLNDKATRKIAGLRGMSQLNRRESASITKDLLEKQSALATMKDEVTSVND